MPTTSYPTCVFDNLSYTPQLGDEQEVSAGWLFPVNGPPVRNGSVRFSDSRITEITPSNGRPIWPTHALLPRPVNLHTHWELSDCRQPLAASSPLPDWIPAVLKHRAETPRPDGGNEATVEGQAESVASHTSVVVDIAQANPPPPAKTMRQFSFVECIGLSSERAVEAFGRAKRFLAADPDHGLSPHAPYSVRPDLLVDVISLATEHGRPITMHLAESPAERVLLEQAVGPFRTMLEGFGLWDASLFGSRTINDVIDQLLNAPRAIIAHGNDLRPDEWRRLSDNATTTVAYCPRTHAFFNYERHPVAEMLADGVHVGLGTDSRASNPDLSVWNEVLFLRNARPDLSPQTLIEMATINGAKAVGLDHQYGAIAVDYDANLLVVPLAKPDATDPYEALFGRSV